MQHKWEVTKALADSGLVIVVRAESPKQAIKIVEATSQGGARAIEITYTVPGATEVIRELVNQFQNTDLIIGAGTVLDPETARMAIMAGARFVVGPNLNPDVVRLCNRYQIPVIQGVSTVNEAVSALELGTDILKFFPGDGFNPRVIKSILGPLPFAPFMPTGGISLENVGDWIKAGCVSVGVGGSLTKGAKTGDYAAITSLTKQFLERIVEARSS